MHLLSISKQFDRAVQLCAEHDVQITEDMAERMTPEKTLGADNNGAEKTVGGWGGEMLTVIYGDLIVIDSDL